MMYTLYPPIDSFGSDDDDDDGECGLLSEELTESFKTLTRIHRQQSRRKNNNNTDEQETLIHSNNDTSSSSIGETTIATTREILSLRTAITVESEIKSLENGIKELEHILHQQHPQTQHQDTNHGTEPNNAIGNPLHHLQQHQYQQQHQPTIIHIDSTDGGRSHHQSMTVDSNAL